MRRYIGAVAALLVLGAGAVMAGHDTWKADTSAAAGSVELSQVKPLATPEPSSAPTPRASGKVAGDSTPPDTQAGTSAPTAVASVVVSTPPVTPAPATPDPTPISTATPVTPLPTPIGCGHCGTSPKAGPLMMCPLSTSMFCAQQ
jgi:hypothetical protein